MIDFAPNRGYNIVTIKENKTNFRKTGQRRTHMKEVAWQEFNKSDRIVAKRKSFKTEEAMEKFIKKITEKDNFYTILATR